VRGDSDSRKVASGPGARRTLSAPRWRRRFSVGSALTRVSTPARSATCGHITLWETQTRRELPQRGSATTPPPPSCTCCISVIAPTASPARHLCGRAAAKCRSTPQPSPQKKRVRPASHRPKTVGPLPKSAEPVLRQQPRRAVISASASSSAIEGRADPELVSRVPRSSLICGDSGKRSRSMVPFSSAISAARSSSVRSKTGMLAIWPDPSVITSRDR